MIEKIMYTIAELLYRETLKTPSVVFILNIFDV